MLALAPCFFPRRYSLWLALFAGLATLSSQAQAPGISGVQGSVNGIDVAHYSAAETSASGSSSSSLDIARVDAMEVAGEGNIALRSSASSAIIRYIVPTPTPQGRPRYGGDHEFTITTGISRMSGHWLGYRKDVDVEVVNLHYSLVIKKARHVTVSFSPEITPYINIEEPILDNNDNGHAELYRKQTVGGGVTPAGFTFDFLPSHRIQPFWRCNYGVLYFHDRVLSPQGSQFMHTVDFGLGFHIYQSRYVSTTLGFRYIHLSNANIAIHNPGTDAETFYVGFSRFHSPKVRDVVR